MELRAPLKCTGTVTRFVTCAAALVLVLFAVIQPASAAEPWRKLHRPLHLPHLAPGASCPVSAIDRRIDWASTNIFGGSGIGRGPVYPGLGGSGGNFTTQLSDSYPGPWFRGKIFWYVTPSYRGPVLIRGHRLDGPESLRFGGSAQ